MPPPSSAAWPRWPAGRRRTTGPRWRGRSHQLDRWRRRSARRSRRSRCPALPPPPSGARHLDTHAAAAAAVAAAMKPPMPKPMDGPRAAATALGRHGGAQRAAVPACRAARSSLVGRRRASPDRRPSPTARRALLSSAAMRSAQTRPPGSGRPPGRPPAPWRRAAPGRQTGSLHCALTWLVAQPTSHNEPVTAATLQPRAPINVGLGVVDVMHASLRCNLHQPLADDLALHHADQRRRCVLETLHDVLVEHQLAAA